MDKINVEITVKSGVVCGIKCDSKNIDVRVIDQDSTNVSEEKICKDGVVFPVDYAKYL